MAEVILITCRKVMPYKMIIVRKTEFQIVFMRILLASTLLLLLSFEAIGQQKINKQTVKKFESDSAVTIQEPPYKGDIALDKVLGIINDINYIYPLRAIEICDSLLSIYSDDELIKIYKVNAITAIEDKEIKIKNFIAYASKESNPNVLSTIIGRLRFDDESGFSSYISESERIATKLITLRGNGDDFYKRGEIRSNLEQYDAALLDYSKALSLASTHRKWEVRQSIAFLYKSSGKYFEAVQIFNQIAEEADFGRNIIFNRGLCKQELHDYIGSMADFNLALNTRNRSNSGSPYKEEILLEKARLHILLKNYDVAVNELISILKTAGPNNDGFKSQVYDLLGVSRYNLKQKEAACNNWSKAGGLGSRDAYDNIKRFCK